MKTLMQLALAGLMAAVPLAADDLAAVKARGTLRHIGICNARFVTGSDGGLEVELLRRFAEDLEVTYEFVESTPASLLSDLTAQRGDLAACGISMTPEHQAAIVFSTPTFPTQVWLIARADAPIQPIDPTGDPGRDIAAVMARVANLALLGKAGTSTDPLLYGVDRCGARIQFFSGTPDDMIPAVVKGVSDAALAEAPVAATALTEWVGRLKVIGPVSPPRAMAVVFLQTSNGLRQHFNQFFARCKEDGTYRRLVAKYYPQILSYQADFFRDCR